MTPLLQTILLLGCFVSALQATPVINREYENSNQGLEARRHTRVVYTSYYTTITVVAGGRPTGAPAPASAPASAPAPAPAPAPASASASAPAPAPSSSNSKWNLESTHSGKSFTSFYQFFTAADPTNGVVQYVAEQDAINANILRYSTAGNPILALETTPNVAGNRKSIRLTSTQTYNAGTLIILDALHAPAGNAVWPAFWTFSSTLTWPTGGEIDIFEYVNMDQTNTASFHTNSGCSMQSGGYSGVLGKGGSNCDTAVDGSACGVTSGALAGAAFNKANGGVYAMRWTTSGISIYFFPRSSIPSDITSGSPNPDSWGVPISFMSSQNCDLAKHFVDHSIVFDTTLCGDWAGKTYSGGLAACNAFAAGNGASFSEAYWEINYVKVFKL